MEKNDETRESWAGLTGKSSGNERTGRCPRDPGPPAAVSLSQCPLRRLCHRKTLGAEAEPRRLALGRFQGGSCQHRVGLLAFPPAPHPSSLPPATRFPAWPLCLPFLSPRLPSFHKKHLTPTLIIMKELVLTGFVCFRLMYLGFQRTDLL